MNRRTAKLSLIISALALLCFVPSSRVGATVPGENGRIAFQADTGTGDQVYTVRPNGHDLRQITHVNVEAVRPDWSPDDRLIAFEHDSATCSSVAIMKADGSNLIDLVPPSPNLCEGDPSFTPDGTRIVFEQFNVDTFEDAIWSMRLDGSERRFITIGTGSGVTDPNISPDGKTLSFVDFNGLDFGQALFTVDINGGNLFQVTPFTFDVAIKQDWAPYGRHLLFTDNADFPPPDSANIATIRPDGTGLRHLTHFQGGVSIGMTAQAQTTTFTYQGKLNNGGTPANGTYDLQFTLWDATSGGTQQPPPSPVTITPRQCSSPVESSPCRLISAQARSQALIGFLRYVLRPAGGPAFTILSPRQEITSTPYSDISTYTSLTLGGFPKRVAESCPFITINNPRFEGECGWLSTALMPAAHLQQRTGEFQ